MPRKFEDPLQYRSVGTSLRGSGAFRAPAFLTFSAEL
jgi:hypothetical protein